MSQGVVMRLHSFSAVFAAAVMVLIFAASPAAAYADRAAGGDTGHHNSAPRTAITPPGPFLQPSPDSYLYPRPPSAQQQQRDDRAWQQQQWQERQWRESQWQERQHAEQMPDWREWGQHDRGDRSSREREGRDRGWHRRTEQGNAGEHDVPAQPGAEGSRNVPAWGYRENPR
jgi:hypothetical protein